MEKTRILITNDDGIRSPGLWTLVEHLASWADVYIVAPHEEQSGMSLSITVRNTLMIHRHYDMPGTIAWSVSGTPADCVKTALSILLKEPPHIVVSGINRGSNAGKNVLYSGTVGGAVEAALRGLPAIAFSSYSTTNPSFEKYAPLTLPLVKYVLNSHFDPGVVLNVNFPCPQTILDLGIQTPICGVKLTAQGKEYILEKPQLLSAPRKDEDHHGTEFQMGIQLVGQEINDETTDIYWLRKGYATCVPVFVEDLTHKAYIEKHKNNFDTIITD